MRPSPGFHVSPSQPVPLTSTLAGSIYITTPPFSVSVSSALCKTLWWPECHRETNNKCCCDLLQQELFCQHCQLLSMHPVSVTVLIESPHSYVNAMPGCLEAEFFLYAWGIGSGCHTKAENASNRPSPEQREDALGFRPSPQAATCGKSSFFPSNVRYLGHRR